jgi:hypothetical protein
MFILTLGVKRRLRLSGALATPEKPCHSAQALLSLKLCAGGVQEIAWVLRVVFCGGAEPRGAQDDNPRGAAGDKYAR